MDTKFNLYDLFGIFIPGGIMCLLIYAFLSGIGVIGQVKLDWAQALIVLPLAYTVGTVIHHFARRFLHIEEYGLNILKKTDTAGFTDDFVDLLIGKIEATFKLKKPAEQNELDEFYQMAFMLCYDYVIQNNKGVYTENFNALYGMCRSMIIVTISGMIFALLYFIFQEPFSDWNHGLAFVATTIFGGMFVIKVLHEGMISNARRYVISVFRSFYVAPSDSKDAVSQIALDAPVKVSLVVTQPRSPDASGSATEK
jgi:hypothetical protein